MKRNIILTVLILTFFGLITCVTHLVIENDLLYQLWCIATIVIGFFVLNKPKQLADFLSGNS